MLSQAPNLWSWQTPLGMQRLTAWPQVLRLLALAYTEEGSQPQLALNCVHKLRSEGSEGIERSPLFVSLVPCHQAMVAASLLAC